MFFGFQYFNVKYRILFHLFIFQMLKFMGALR